MNNRTSPIVRIILWSLIGVVAMMILINTANSGGVNFNGFLPSASNQNLTVQKETIINEEIDTIDIAWYTGGVKLSVSNDNTIKLVEKSSKQTSSDRLLNYTVNQKVLKIESRNKHTVNFFFFSLNSPTYLEISVPERIYESIEIKAASGTYDFTGLKTKNLAVTLASGDVTLMNSEIDSLDTTTVSGRLISSNTKIGKAEVNMTSGSTELDGEIHALKLTMTSGNAEIDMSILPDQLDIRITSGIVRAALPENTGFKVAVDKTSGYFSSDFALSSIGNSYTYGTGGPSYSVKITSGNIQLRKGN